MPKPTLVDHLGRPYYASTTGYAHSGSTRRSMRGWSPSIKSADQDINPNLEQMRASSRDLYMNAPLATGALKRAGTNVIGYGLTLQSRVDRDLLGLSLEEADQWESRTEREFRLWARSKNCDATRTQNFYGMQKTAFVAELMSGDVFILRCYKRRLQFPYELCLKIVEADFVSNPHNVLDTANLSGGIETDNDGQPVKYWMRKGHPGDLVPKYEWQSVPAYGAKSGTWNVLHLFEKERPGQRRGVPLLAPVIEILKQISRLSEAELMAAIITSFYTVFIKTPSGAMAEDVVPDSQKVSGSSDSDANTYELGSGLVMGLAEGEEIEQADPKRPNRAFEPFFLAMVRQIGSAIEIPFEVLILHFTASYSASRAAMLQAWKWFVSRRNTFKLEFCEPVYLAFLTEAILKGRIEAPGFFDDPLIAAAWSGSEWMGPGMGQLNPEVETRAAALRVQNHFSTRTKETAMIDGDDWDAMIPTRMHEEQVITKAGLPRTEDEVVSQQSSGAVDDKPEEPQRPPENNQDDSDTEDDSDA